MFSSSLVLIVSILGVKCTSLCFYNTVCIVFWLQSRVCNETRNVIKATAHLEVPFRIVQNVLGSTNVSSVSGHTTVGPDTSVTVKSTLVNAERAAFVLCCKSSATEKKAFLKQVHVSYTAQHQLLMCEGLNRSSHGLFMALINGAHDLTPAVLM